MADDPKHTKDEHHAPGDSHSADAHAADKHADDHHGGAHDPFDANHLIGHVQDALHFHVPALFTPNAMEGHEGHIYIPQVFSGEPIATVKTGFDPIDTRIQPLTFAISKFMVIEAIVGIILVVLFAKLANKLRGGQRPVGRMANALEAMLVFIRDEVARPAIGHHDADKFLPFLWTMFFFVLGCNLFGMLPWAGSPTGSLATTGTLALITFGTVVGAGMAKLGPVHFLVAQVPHMDLPLPLMIMLWPMIFVIEVMGMFIKHFILAMRLLANMMAGHLVLSVIIGFIAASASAGIAVMSGVTVASILGATALSLLELFVAFLQAYIFTFLSALFIGMAVHPH